MVSAKLLSALASVVLAAGCVGLQKPGMGGAGVRPEILSIEAEADISSAKLTAVANISGDCSCGFIIRNADASEKATIRAIPTACEGNSDGTGKCTFTAEVVGLDPATTYRFSAFISNSINSINSQEKEFATKELSPTPEEPETPPEDPATPDDEPITIPDEAFRDYLLWHYDTNEDGILTMSEADAIDVLEIGGTEITDLTGIAFFRNMWKFCYEAPRTEDDEPGCGVLTSVDVSGNPGLQELNIVNQNLTEIDLSRNTELRDLGLYKNPITSLDLSHQHHLVYISCGFCKLEAIDLSVSESLDEVHLDHNKLKSITLGDHKNIRYLDCSYNLLESLDISGCKALNAIDCTNNPDLKVIYMDKRQKLGCLTCDEGLKIEYKE